MGALNALRRSPGAVARNPVLVVPVLVVGLFQLPQLLLQASDPLLAGLASLGLSAVFVLVTPFFQGGLVGMADEALEGRTGLGTFVADGSAHYVSLLVAYLLLLVVHVVIGVVLLAVAFVGGILVLQYVDLPAGAIGFLGLFLVLFPLAVLLLTFFVQFYAQAIVLDGEGATGGLRRSVGLVRRNLLSTLGYTLLGGVVGGVLGLGFGALSVVFSPDPTVVPGLSPLSPPQIAVLALVVVVAGSLVGSFLAVFSVAFYREIST